MNARVATNVVLAGALAAAGIYLLAQDTFFFRSRWHPGHGLVFSGWSLYCLAGALFALAGFAGTVARAWRRGDIPQPPAGAVRPHPAYKGGLIVRFWYFIVFALAALTLGFTLARPM
ncbi:MAG: hypothetical protein P8009_09690 [Gammaproteobacteria bacterium]